MRFAPEAFRSTRVKTTEQVKSALLATHDLRDLDTTTLRSNPSALSTLRMCTAPPLAVDRLVGLALANKGLIGRMEKGKLPSRMKVELLEENLARVCRVLSKLLDRDIFPWLESNTSPTDHERDRASTIVADRLCSAVANPIVRNAQEQRQLELIGKWLDARGYRKQSHRPGKPLAEMMPGTYALDLTCPLASHSRSIFPLTSSFSPSGPVRIACRS
jgi:hypothetical protein